VRKKITLALVILFSFFAVVALPASWNTCLPDGCSFDSNVCDSTSCINETLGQHLDERTSLFSVIVGPQSSTFLFAFILLAFFAFQESLQKHFLELIRFEAGKLYAKYKVFSSLCSKLVDYLLEAFSSGILHSQIYSVAN